MKPTWDTIQVQKWHPSFTLKSMLCFKNSHFTSNLFVLLQSPLNMYQTCILAHLTPCQERLCQYWRAQKLLFVLSVHIDFVVEWCLALYKGLSLQFSADCRLCFCHCPLHPSPPELRLFSCWSICWHLFCVLSCPLSRSSQCGGCIAFCAARTGGATALAPPAMTTRLLATPRSARTEDCHVASEFAFVVRVNLPLQTGFDRAPSLTESSLQCRHSSIVFYPRCWSCR